jgi:hypothetical protein
MGDGQFYQCGNVTRRDLSAFVASDASGKLNPVCFGKGLVGEMRCNDLPGRGIWCSRCPVPRGEERVPINVTDLNGNAGGTGSATGGSGAFQPSSTPDSSDGEPRRFLVTVIAVPVGALVGIAFLVVSIFVVRKRRRDAYSKMDGDRGGIEGAEGADTVRIQMSDVAGNGLHQNPMNRGDSPQRFQQQRSSQREKGNKQQEPKRDNLPTKAKSQRVPPTPPVYTSRHLDLIDVRKRQSAKLDGWSEGVGGGAAAAAASSSSVSSTAPASSSSTSTSSSSKRRVPPTPPTYSAKQLDLIRVRQEQKAKEAARRSEEEGAERVGDGGGLEEGWEEVTSEDGTYYWNRATNDTSWERPTVSPPY